MTFKKTQVEAKVEIIKKQLYKATKDFSSIKDEFFIKSHSLILLEKPNWYYLEKIKEFIKLFSDFEKQITTINTHLKEIKEIFLK